MIQSVRWLEDFNRNRKHLALKTLPMKSLLSSYKRYQPAPTCKELCAPLPLSTLREDTEGHILQSRLPTSPDKCLLGKSILSTCWIFAKHHKSGTYDARVKRLFPGRRGFVQSSNDVWTFQAGSVW
jgi:hypothetical protein